MIILVCFLCLLTVILLLYIFLLKKILRNVKKELIHSREKGYNKQVTVSLMDRDVISLVGEVNKNLDFQKQMKHEVVVHEERLKQSISDIAHDLRTPLSVIKDNLQLLSRSGHFDMEQQGYWNICMEKTEYIKDVINDFFELSVLESDDVNVALERVDLTSLLVKFLIEHEAIIQEEGFEPVIDLPQRSVFGMVDSQMLNRMLTNLLNNIMKYARDTFSVFLEDDDYHCMITFENEMQGSFDLERIFHRTYQGDDSRQKNGAGLGLYIVRLLAQKQEIEVKAKEEEKRFSISLYIKK